VVAGAGLDVPRASITSSAVEDEVHCQKVLDVVESPPVAHELVQVAELADHAPSGVEAPGKTGEQPVAVEAPRAPQSVSLKSTKTSS